MKKVIILSYFFTPCNLTASQRALGWANYLKEFGYYPIVITRNWDLAIEKPEDTGKSSGKSIFHEKNDKYEVYYLPYKSSLRDRLYVKGSNSNFISIIRKGLTFIEMLFNNFTTRVLPYHNLYSFSKSFLKKNRDINHLIISASPFPLFRIGYLLNKKFGIKWLADYRDDWATNEVRIYSKLEKFLNLFERNSERKWVGSASAISSISNHYTNKISTYTGIKGKTLLNGFFEEDFKYLNNLKSTKFTIIYNGTLYDSQPIEMFLSAFKSFIDQHSSNKENIKFIFAGTAYDKNQVRRITDFSSSFIENIEITARRPRKEILALQNSAQALIMISHTNCKGIPSSKIYEYLAMGKPILSYPSDGDIIDETLGGYNLGYVCKNEEEILNQLNKLYFIYNSKSPDVISDKEYVNQFSRKNQSKLTADLLDTF
jgi:glycosyltransferase involved in cell wall biosynthesis